MKHSIYCCYAPVEPHHPLIFYLFISLFKLFFSQLYIYIYIIKNKKLFFSLLVHTYYYTSCNFSPPFLSFYLPTTLGFIVTLPSSFYLSYILTLLLPILFCINLMSFLPFNPDFQHNLSLSVDFPFFLICVLVLCVCVCVCVCFPFPIRKVLCFPFITLIEFWFWLILRLFWK